MSDYRRWRVAGGTYFFTVVTRGRMPLFTAEAARGMLRESVREVRQRHPFEIIAVVLLPDHLHMVIELPRGDVNYSVRLRQIKTRFTQRYSSRFETKAGLSRSRAKRGEHNVWQRRFYEHTVHDEADLLRCADYIHVNPVKHRLVKRVCDWPWSSFHRWVREGHYSVDWGCSDEWFGDEFELWE